VSAAGNAGRAGAAAATHAIPASSWLQIVILALVWGCNWPVLKLGVTELPPLTFRASTLLFAAICLLAISKASGQSIRVPREWWTRVVVLAILNIAAWNALVVFGIQQMPAGRSAILAYTMPIWSVPFTLALLHEPLSRRKIVGLLLGLAGMLVLLGDDLGSVQRSPLGAMLILAAAILWAFGTVLLRRWQPPMPQNTLSGWMMVVAWVPIALCAPLLDPHPVASLMKTTGTAWFAIVYNIFFAGTLAHWAWFKLARTLPVAVSSMSSLPVPVVGVFSGMIFLGERPGASEFIALALVVASLIAVLFTPAAKPMSPPPAPD
jgi:drug/metabolite transporter (DMT)-like permease